MNKMSTKQKHIIQYCLDQGFLRTSVPEDFCLLQSEVSEAFMSYYKHEDTHELALELADICIYCYVLASRLGIDLDTAIEEKNHINEQRHYELVNGTLVKTANTETTEEKEKEKTTLTTKDEQTESETTESLEENNEIQELSI